MTTDGHQDIVFKILECEEVDKIWKEEVLLTVITKEHLKDIYYRIISDMAGNNYAMLKRITFLINTCCRVAEHKESICWDKEMASVVIEVLDSWTKHIENKKEENTALAGKIGLFLLEFISNDKGVRYELKDELNHIFHAVLDAQKGDGVDACYAKINSNVYRMYGELAERGVTDIYHYGQIPFAMPEMTIRLMETIWVSQGQLLVYRSVDIDSYFGLNMCMVMPDFTENMKTLSKESRETSDYHFQYMIYSYGVIINLMEMRSLKNTINIPICQLF
ncbi:MAG: hypothetical protein K2L82_17705 [Lachnospiraceae bacterium]|nr:hypothetical protein [Lachnospiraceae bacterium]